MHLKWIFMDICTFCWMIRNDSRWRTLTILLLNVDKFFKSSQVIQITYTVHANGQHTPGLVTLIIVHAMKKTRITTNLCVRLCVTFLSMLLDTSTYIAMPLPMQKNTAPQRSSQVDPIVIHHDHLAPEHGRGSNWEYQGIWDQWLTGMVLIFRIMVDIIRVSLIINRLKLLASLSKKWSSNCLHLFL